MRPDIQETFDLLKKSLKTNPNTLDVIEALYDLANSSIEKEKQVTDGVEIAKYAREEMEKVICPDIADPIKRVREVWRIIDDCRDNSLAVDEIYVYMDILLLLARNMDFDSYLLYLEKNRLEKDRLYLPKRKQFLKVGIIDSLQDMIDDKLDILTISMPPGTGKAQPMYSKVLTPNGFVEMRDIKVGSKVISGTGNVCNVIGVYPQGVRSIYELTLDDGSCCRCSDNHLWRTQTKIDLAKNKYRTIELKDMLKNYKIGGKQSNYCIDYVKKIDIGERDLKIHPYLLGVLLGDGCFTKKNIILAIEDEIAEKLTDFLPDKYSLRKYKNYMYLAKANNDESGRGHKGKLRIYLEEYGLFGKYSDNKFIPRDYLYSTYENRLWLLRGLLDTDGYVSKAGYVSEYTSTSKELACGVVELVRSLGGYASIAEKETKSKKAYRVIIEFTENADNPFYLSRKAKRFMPKKKGQKRFIRDIKYIGDEECQCIYIDDDSHLYITDDYIITHNTTLSKFFISGVIGWFPNDFNLFWSHSADIARMYYDGVNDILTNSTEYNWQEIFVGLAVTSTNAKAGSLNVGRYRPFQSLQTTSTGAENAGKVRASKFLMLDDLIGKLEEALNINQLEKLWRAYNTDSRQRKIDGCKEIHIATRWSVHDVIGKLQRAYEGNTKTRTRFIAIPDIDEETGESNFDYEYDGFSKEFYEDQALLMDDISYRCLYKNQPIEREGLLYHNEDLRRYLSLPMQEPDAVLAVCDVKNKGTDFMFMPVMYQYGNDYYLVDCVCDDNSDFDIQYEKLKNMLVKYNVQACEFESNAGGDRAAYEVELRLLASGSTCTITTHPTETNKETRIIVNAEWVKRNVLFRDKSLYTPKEDYGIMMNWLLCYSTVGKNNHDDVPDGLANFRLYVDGMRPQIATVEAAFNPFRSRGYY